MVQVAKLSADLFANTAKFESGLLKAGNSMKSFQKTVSKSTKIASVAILGVGTTLGLLGRKQSDVIDETAKLTAALGVNIREFQALAMVARESGISQDLLGNAITKSQRSIVEASRGLQTYARSFETLGLSVEDLLQLSPDQQFNQIASALSEIESPTLRTATALEIFGRNGRQVINMLDGYNENVQKAREFNDKWNISLTEVDASKVEEANDTFGRVQEAINGLGNVIAVKFAPLVTLASNALLDAGFSGEKFGIAVDKGMQLAAGAIDIVRHATLGLKLTFNAVIITISDAVVKLSVVLFDLGQQLAKTFSMIPGVSLEAETAILDIGLAAKKMSDGAEKDLNKVIGKMRDFEETSKIFDRIQKQANERNASNDNPQPVGGVFEGLEKKAKKSTKAVKETNKEMTELEKATESLKKSTEQTFNGMVNDIARGENALDSLKGALLSIVNNLLSKTLENANGGITSGLGDIVGGIFKGVTTGSFATGTNFVPRDMVANVHRGEMIIPRQQVESMMRGDNATDGSNITQNINVTTGVEQTVQAEIRRFMPEFRQIAVDAQRNAQVRNMA